MIPEVWRRDKPLAATGGLMFVALIVVLFIAPFDERTLLGLNVWVKPVKFLASVGVFVWTLAWFMPYVAWPAWLRGIVSWGVSGAMILENSLHVMHAARGVPSHLNFETALDARIFQAMGNTIGVNTAYLASFALMLFARPSEWPRPPYLWAFRIGVLLLLAGSLEGMLMISNGAHAVGLPDGGPGLRFVNFSTEGGDLRVAHLLGLHGFQVLPLFALWVRRRSPELDDAGQTRIVLGFGVFYILVTALLFSQAMAGRPVLPV